MTLYNWPWTCSFDLHPSCFPLSQTKILTANLNPNPTFLLLFSLIIILQCVNISEYLKFFYLGLCIKTFFLASDKAQTKPNGFRKYWIYENNQFLLCFRGIILAIHMPTGMHWGKTLLFLYFLFKAASVNCASYLTPFVLENNGGRCGILCYFHAFLSKNSYLKSIHSDCCYFSSALASSQRGIHSGFCSQVPRWWMCVCVRGHICWPWEPP